MASPCLSPATIDRELALSIASRDQSKMSQKIHRFAKELSHSHSPVPLDDPWLRQLDWTLVENAHGFI